MSAAQVETVLSVSLFTHLFVHLIIWIFLEDRFYFPVVLRAQLLSASLCMCERLPPSTTARVTKM